MREGKGGRERGEGRGGEGRAREGHKEGKGGGRWTHYMCTRALCSAEINVREGGGRGGGGVDGWVWVGG